ncbi:hypothetical protein GCM10009839_37980 [Catenulispora yoronensis]|uniref:Uncharacterized protein n=1 Tax=Catenulispora yoronensis TaxID=450799 RepID=A0ABN2UCU4_9ACTN
MAVAPTAKYTTFSQTCDGSAPHCTCPTSGSASTPSSTAPAHVAHVIAVSGSISANTFGAANVKATQHTALSKYNASPASRSAPAPPAPPTPPAPPAPTR